MCRVLLLPALVIGLVHLHSQGDTRRPVADLVADLKKGDPEKLKAIKELEALGEKAAEAAPALVELLRGNNEDVRLQATIALGKIGNASAEPLAKALSDKDADVRFYAAWGLAFVGPPAKGTTGALVKALGDSSAQVRRKAAYALGRIDPDPEAVVAGLVGALGDADADVRQAAAEALPKMGKAAVPALIKALSSDKVELRNTAIKTLGEIGSAAEPAIGELKAFLLQPDKGASDLAADALAGIGAAAIPVLAVAADDDSEVVRPRALAALLKIGAPAVPAIVDLLGAKHDEVRRLVATRLGSIQVRDKMIVIGLGYATKDKDYLVRLNALHSLRGMGTGAKLAEPYVTALLTDVDLELRKEAFQTLQALGVDARPGLKKALSNSDPAVRISTAGLMVSLNIEVDLAEPVLLDGLKEKDESLKVQSAYALAQRGLQVDAVLPIFIAGLKHENAGIRRQSAEALVRYGPKARKAAPDLLTALDDADNSVRAQVLEALRQVGEEPRTLLPAMIKILRRKNDPLHDAAAQVVMQAGPEAVGEIVTALKQEDAAPVRQACLQTLATIGPPAKDAVPELIKALSDPAARNRLNAARALGNIGPDAKDAVDALTQAEKDSDANVKLVSQAALTQIRADPKQKEFQVQGVLTAADPMDRSRKQMHHVVHTYYMKAGQNYTIDLISPWDNYLRLENAQGKQLAEDDDSGGNLNARIVIQAPADGWYRIIVTSYSAGVTGNYTLKVR
jgi:HEAT repeat protein